ncbi:hypothetical protein FOA43_003894 [Brettanomyces nanus]|uniref:Uncharacterized protein n=1 Tax=Eeniella nana TaxID=13502 RepID=A0A875S8H3_EENNA|nr:uncharacterized protein FOA43_003894 [Brettanomyces nanus]QPG76505.1 hypothetical protein FOA43_003894 [Brettanomyces nanus]
MATFMKSTEDVSFSSAVSESYNVTADGIFIMKRTKEDQTTAEKNSLKSIEDGKQLDDSDEDPAVSEEILSAQSSTLNLHSNLASWKCDRRSSNFQVSLPTEDRDSIFQFVLDTLETEMDSINDNDEFVKMLKENNFNDLKINSVPIVSNYGSQSASTTESKGSRFRKKITWLFQGVNETRESTKPIFESFN